MKKITVVLLIIVLVLALSVGVFAFQNEPDGFRGLKWGDPPTEDMEFVYGGDISKNYMRPDDKMSVGKAVLEFIVYAFVDVDGELMFYSADLLFVNEGSFDILKAVCKQRFGPPAFEQSEELDWVDKVSGKVVSEAGIELSYDFVDDAGLLRLYHVSLFTVWSDLNEKEKAKSDESDW